MAGYRKLETELPFLKKVNIRDWNVLSVKGMIFRIVTAKILNTKPKKKLNSLRPGTKGFFTRGKWIIGYNFGTDDNTESKFDTHKELIVLNILKYEYCLNKSRDMSRDHFAKNCKLLNSWWPA